MLARFSAPIFVVANEKSTLYYTANIKDRITREFKASFDVDEPFASFLPSVPPASTPGPWEQLGIQKVRVGKPQFLRINEPDTFHWRSPVTIVRAYTRVMADSSILRAFGAQEHRILIAKFVVEWRADITSEGEITAGGIDSISEGERRFETATPQLIDTYDLRALRRLQKSS